jgi:glutamine synthetase
MYEEGHKIQAAKKLPATLLDASRLLDQSKVLRDGLGNELVDSYTKLKMQEWRGYTSHLSDWERMNTAEC